MMISMLVQALYNIVDSIFVSHVNEAALSAVSLAFPKALLKTILSPVILILPCMACVACYFRKTTRSGRQKKNPVSHK